MAFTPISGNLMASADYSALESRLGADIYNEESMIKEYLEGSGDILNVSLHRNMQLKIVKNRQKDFDLGS